MSSDASTSTSCARKTTKNMAGLSLDLSFKTSTSQQRFAKQPPEEDEFPITACSPSTPSLEFDWSSDDSIDLEDDSEAQYLFIPYDSPFYRSSTPCSSAYIAFTSFPFTCDALREDGSMFSRSPYFVFQEKADYEDTRLLIVDGDTEDNFYSRENVDWSPKEFDGIFLLEQSKSPVPDSEEEESISWPY